MDIDQPAPEQGGERGGPDAQLGRPAGMVIDADLGECRPLGRGQSHHGLQAQRQPTIAEIIIIQGSIK